MQARLQPSRPFPFFASCRAGGCRDTLLLFAARTRRTRFTRRLLLLFAAGTRRARCTRLCPGSLLLFLAARTRCTRSASLTVSLLRLLAARTPRVRLFLLPAVRTRLTRLTRPRLFAWPFQIVTGPAARALPLRSSFQLQRLTGAIHATPSWATLFSSAAAVSRATPIRGMVRPTTTAMLRPL